MDIETEPAVQCPICKGSTFIDHRGRPKAKCATCGSLERMRVTMLLLENVINLKPGMKVLHFAPERPLAGYIHGICGEGYHAYDLDPSGYKNLPVEVLPFDLCKGCRSLPSDTYDLVMHNHVLEHLPCNYTIVLQELQRAVKPGGYHMFSAPIPAGHYDEALDPSISGDERIARFLQNDHVRRFGKDDFEATLGMVFQHKADYSVLQYVTGEQLTVANVRKHWWTLSGAAPFIVRKVEKTLEVALSTPVLRSRILTDPVDLDLVRTRLRDGDSRTEAAWNHVREVAETYLEQRGLSVTENVRLPPSGDKHDYMSVGTYWWPNPDTKDGLPYVRRDGEINPEFFDSDVDRMRKLCDAVAHLGLAFAVSQDVKYAEKAAELVRHWFIAPDTRMNPHLAYAQFVPGVVEGRSYGIIDLKPIRELLDAIGMLSTNAWTTRDQDALLAWMTSYLQWLTTSDFGKKECSRSNNHGTWYDAQTLSVALFVGDLSVARLICERTKERIAQQITPNGEQPAELERTRPLTYCIMNLQAFFDLATMAERCGVDLWRFETTDGRSLRKAAEWILPFVLGESTFPQGDIVKAAPQNYLSVFRRAAIKFKNPRFEDVVRGCEQHGTLQSATHLLQFPERSEVLMSTVSSATPPPPPEPECKPECNLCGGTTFENWKNRPNSLCSQCHSQERTRVLKLYLDRLELGPESKILHIAPERSLAAYLAEKVGSGTGYDAVDINPKRYAFANARKLDLVADVEGLPSDHYDLILHVHVIEHLPCDVTSVLFHLHRALKPDGLHLCSIPILKGRYAAEFTPMSPERALKEFGHKEHVRRFGRDDIHKTLGMIFELPAEYDLESEFDVATLDRFNVPVFARKGWSPHTVLAWRKNQIKLRG